MHDDRAVRSAIGWIATAVIIYSTVGMVYALVVFGVAVIRFIALMVETKKLSGEVDAMITEIDRLKAVCTENQHRYDEIEAYREEMARLGQPVDQQFINDYIEGKCDWTK